MPSIKQIEVGSQTHRRITTEFINPLVVLVDPRFQPRTEAGVNDLEIEKMRSEGRRRGYKSGWDPSLYDPVKVWNFSSQLYIFEGYHRTSLAISCGVHSIEARVHYGYDESEIVALANRSNTKFRPQE